jgi:hypothetical protein
MAFQRVMLTFFVLFSLFCTAIRSLLYFTQSFAHFGNAIVQNFEYSLLYLAIYGISASYVNSFCTLLKVLHTLVTLLCKISSIVCRSWLYTVLQAIELGSPQARPAIIVSITFYSVQSTIFCLNGFIKTFYIIWFNDGEYWSSTLFIIICEETCYCYCHSAHSCLKRNMSGL